jgi:chromosome segregation ATPase
MKLRTSVAVGAAVCGALFFFFSPAGGLRAQPPTPAAAPQADTLAALLAEVRQLRLALERSALLGVRMQLAAQRLSLQEQRVQQLAAQASAAQAQAARAAAELVQIAQHVERLEEAATQETDAQQRKNLSNEHSALKARLEQQTLAEQELRRRESELLHALQPEKARLDELSGKLDEFEREVDQALRPRPR